MHWFVPMFRLLSGFPVGNVGYVNLGKIDVKGWELNLSWRDKIGSVKLQSRVQSVGRP